MLPSSSSILSSASEGLLLLLAFGEPTLMEILSLSMMGRDTGIIYVFFIILCFLLYY